MKIAFLINNAYGIGGTIRATVNLSSALAVRHEVEVVSVHRAKETPQLPLSDQVRLTSLIDMRKDSPAYEGDDALTAEPCTMFQYGLPYSGLEESRIKDWLRTTDADVVIATRPDLNGFLVRDGHPRYLRIGQEHLSLDAYSDDTRDHQNRAIAGLDAYITVSEADAAQYRSALPEVSTDIRCIPNSVPSPAVELSTLRSKTIVAAGRLISIKRYDRLVDAFAKVASRHPDWTLRIYGRGPEKQALRTQIDELGLYDRAFLMGPVSPIETEWAKGAIAAVSSDMESFGMTIVEAMHCGVPVVATDCPHGPAEIIDHDTTGVLVPLDGGTDAYADALARLMADSDLRERIGAAARERAAEYAPRALARRYEELFRHLSGARHDARGQAGTGGRGLSLLRRLRPSRTAARPKTSTAVQPSLSQGPAESRPSYRPVAHARALTDGGISVHLEAATLPPGPLDFVTRLRRDPKGREIVLPVPAVATTHDLNDVRITLTPEDQPLAEGRWDCYVTHRASGRRFRLASGLAEQSRRMGHLPVAGSDAITSALPYTTTDGFLALRAWNRPGHAEVDSIRIDEVSATITATFMAPGSETSLRDATIVAVSRHSETHDFTLPIHPLEDGSFRFTLPYAIPLGLRHDEHDLWDLLLHRGALATPVRLGRIGGDIVDRKKTDLVPARHLTSPTHGRTRIKPYFTTNNDLALSLRDTTEQPGEGS